MPEQVYRLGPDMRMLDRGSARAALWVVIGVITFVTLLFSAAGGLFGDRSISLSVMTYVVLNNFQY